MRVNEEILIKYLDNYGLDIFTKEQLKEAALMGDSQLNFVLASLIRSKYIDIIERGKYCKHNFRDHFVIGSFVAENAIISYWNAMNYHGLTEQIPNVIYVKTDKDKRSKTYFGIRYFFTRKAGKCISGYITEGVGNHKYRISNIERTLVDAFDKPKFSGGYAEIIKAFSRAKIDENKLIEYCKEENNISLVKRLAYLADILNKPQMSNFLKYSKSLIKDKYTLFEIDGEPNGVVDNKWKIILNIPKEEILEIAES
jgi:predicted transcriptional regulator of viral defense system